MTSLLRISLYLLCVFRVASGAQAALTTPFQLATNAKNPLVWQEFHPWLMITEDLSSGRVCYWLDHNNKSRLNLKPAMPGNWVPLGSAIKWLMYVDYYQGLSRLMAHDVDWHAYYIAWPSVRNQVGVGMTGTKCIYGQYRSSMVNGHYPVDLQYYEVSSGACVPFLVSDSEKSQFAHDGSLIVYRAIIGPGDARIHGVRFNGGPEIEIAARDGIQPTVCGNLVAWAETSGSGYSIVATDIYTGDVRTVAFTTADPPRAQAGRGAIFWQADGGSTGLDIHGYDWTTQQQFTVTSAAGDQYNLRVCDDLVTWVTGAANYQTLWGAFNQPSVKVNDLHAELVTGTSVRLGWTAPGYAQDVPVAYDLRTRADGPITEANWAECVSVPGLPPPASPGAVQTFEVEGLAPGGHYFAIKSRSASGQWSLLSDCIRVWVSGQPECLAAEYGSYVTFSGAISGVGADGRVYCQSTSAPVAVCAKPSAGRPTPVVGQVVACTGLLSRTPDFVGPLVDQAVFVAAGGQQPVKALAMSNRALGGYSERFGGIPGGGAPNTWVLVKVWGTVSAMETSGGGCSFFVSDGSLDGLGIRVTSPFAPPTGLTSGSFVCVEGICRISVSKERQIEVVAPNGIDIGGT